MYKYHVMGARTLAGVQEELERRSDEGWEPAFVYHEVPGAWGFLLYIPGSCRPQARPSFEA